MTRSSSSSTSSKPRALETAVDDPLLVLVLLILEHLLQTSSSGGGGVGKTTRAWGRRRLAPAARLAPRAGGLMMEDLHSWLHQRRRCRFCFCSPLAYSAAIGGGMGYCRGMDAASFGAGNLGAEGSSVRRKHGGGVQGIIPSLFCELHIPKEGQKSSLPDNYTCSFPRTGAAAAQGATPYSTVLEYTWCKSTSLIFRKSTCSQQQQQRQSPTAATDAVANSSSRSARSRSGGLQRWQ
ncbi:uncharacterized protein [Triticum aestivum]|uniref:uncharacterized protein isoform X3 n=1 Tax=Triticum aestivum TaxID=4565 RepID=UPI001D02DF6C|nr:uncharacterized protein LOC123132850 isoform X3 [Triticum aestivum]